METAMTTIHSATASASVLDLARFDLFLNLFVRTPERPARRRATRKRSS